MKNKDDIIILCDELENCKKKSICHFNEIVCAKGALRKYINEDKDKILKLKVQLDLHKNFNQNTLTIITIVLLFLIIIVMIEIAFKYYSLNYTREKWMRYIEYALQDIEKEY